MLQKCLDVFGFEWFFVYLAISAFTGMRQAEVIGLDVDKIDFDKNIIKVRQQYTRNELKGKLKTKSSYRDIDMFPLFASILKTYIIKKRIFKGALLKGNTGSNRANSSFMLKKYWKCQMGGFPCLSQEDVLMLANSALIKSCGRTLWHLQIFQHFRIAIVNNHAI